MTVTSSLLFFSVQSLMRLDILLWLITLIFIIVAAVVLWFQLRNYHEIRSDLDLLAKVKPHSVEYDLVIQTMKLAILRYDIPTRTLTIESDYRDLSGCFVCSPGTSVDTVFLQMVPDYVETFRKGMHDLVTGRVDVCHTQYQMKMLHSDRTYWSEAYATVDKRDLQGNPQTLVCTVMCIDQQKEIESALMDAVYHAEESDRLKSAFLANISHEIRTPLNAIVGFSDVLTMVDDEEERQKLNKLIKQNNTHLLRLFDDIVSMSKLEARGGNDIVKSTFPLESVFQELAIKYAATSQDTGVSLEISRSCLPTLTTDRDRLREILNQYLNNAMKFTTQGSVTMGCDAVGDKWRIYVRDTGKGIPADRCNEQLFERFVKVDEFVPGTGLGLSICRSLAILLGGSVGVESTFGEGSTFWVELNNE
ncbi:MAG: HAMP domain-containing histidine kinase [Prevotella sp.]|nr:HAMP domain-containing histidine kinase [Prevotella sp.]